MLSGHNQYAHLNLQLIVNGVWCIVAYLTVLLIWFDLVVISLDDITSSIVINWSIYNESLVRRGEIILGFDIIDNWNNELHRMNQGKEGALYRYPNSFIQLLGYLRIYFHLPYRQTEGVVTAHAGKKAPSIPDYSTINRRVSKQT